MLNNRLGAAKRVADKLFAAEKAIDEAVQKAADLAATMTVARIEANISAVVGQDALEAASRSLAALVKARSLVVETHNRLSDVKDEIGLAPRALGGGMIKPSFGSVEGRKVQILHIA